MSQISESFSHSETPESQPAESCHAARFGDLHFDIYLETRLDDPISQTFAAGGFWEPHLCDLMLQLVKPGDTVLDLGAHLGTISLTAAAAGCRVLAVEASLRNVELLERSRSRNNFTNLHVIHAAVGNMAGLVNFSPHGPFGHVFTPAVNMASTPTRLARVEQLLQEAGHASVALIKMDIEGSEIAALEGMSQLLGRGEAPPLIYECNGIGLNYYHHTTNQLKAVLEGLGYRNYLIQPDRGLVPVKASDPQPQYTVDYLAIKHPPEGLGNWSIRPRWSRAQIVAEVLRCCHSPSDPNYRAHLQHVLQTEAPDWLRCNQRVQKALGLLPTPRKQKWLHWLTRWWRRAPTRPCGSGSPPSSMAS